MSDDKYARNLARWEKMVAEDRAKRLQEPLSIDNFEQRIMDMQAEIARMDEAAARMDEATAHMDEATAHMQMETARREEEIARMKETTVRLEMETARFKDAAARSNEATARFLQRLHDGFLEEMHEGDDPDEFHEHEELWNSQR
jgi:uncharacterized small protein (DUF1192 family)